MILTRAYKTEIDPNDAQRQKLVQHAGASRWAFNWGLARKIEAYRETGKSPSAIDLHRELNILKKVAKVDGGVPWMYESSKAAPQEALRDLDKAFTNFFRRVAKGEAKKGFPRFKSRRRDPLKFRSTDSVKARNNAFYLPRIGWVKLKEAGYIPTQSFSQVSVSERAGHWFVSVITKLEVPDLQPPTNDAPMGVDAGVARLATLSDGTVF